jgi:Disulphide bond corrector protein DsbC
MRKLVLILLVTAAFAQLDGARVHNKGYVTADASPTVSVSPGKSAQVEVRFRVNPGYHVNSHTPGLDLLIPTTLEFKPTDKIKAGKIAYPAGEQLALEFSPKDKLSVYSGDLAIQVPVMAAKDAAPGQYALKGELQYQACNDNSCFPPKNLPVEIKVVVKK